MKCCVYPYSNEFREVMLHAHQLADDIDIIDLVTLSSWQQEINMEKLSVRISTDFFGAVNDSECMIAAEFSGRNNALYKDILDKMKYSIQRGKSVICCMELEERDADGLEQGAKENKVEFTYLRKKKSIKNRLFQKSNAIIIYIGCLFSGIDTSDVFMKVMDYYRENDYKVTGIVSNYNLMLLGYDEFPEYIYETKGDSASWQIEELNHYFIGKYIKYRSQVMVVQLSGGLMKYSDLCPDGYGLRTYLLSQAIQPDCIIMKSPFLQFGGEFYEGISEAFKYKYGSQICSVVICGKLIDDFEAKENGKILYEKVPLQVINEYVEYMNRDGKYIYYHSEDDVDGLAEESRVYLSSER